jgi:hypothetical protein
LRHDISIDNVRCRQHQTEEVVYISYIVEAFATRIIDTYVLVFILEKTHSLGLFSFLVITLNFHGGNNVMRAGNLLGVDEYY